MGSTDVAPVESLAGIRLDILPSPLAERWAKVDPKYLDMTEHELRFILRRSTGPREEDMSLLIRMRILFWEEFERATAAAEKMDLRRMTRLAGNGTSYWRLFEKYPALLPWILCPLAGIFLERQELEFLSQERMFEILATSAVKADGKTDSRLAKVQFEIYRELQDRIHGPVVQKIQSEQKNLNVNVEAGAQSEVGQKAIGLITDVSELDRRIEAVKQKREALQTVPQPVQVIDQQKLMRPDVLEGELVK